MKYCSFSLCGAARSQCVNCDPDHMCTVQSNMRQQKKQTVRREQVIEGCLTLTFTSKLSSELSSAEPTRSLERAHEKTVEDDERVAQSVYSNGGNCSP